MSDEGKKPDEVQPEAKPTEKLYEIKVRATDLMIMDALINVGLAHTTGLAKPDSFSSLVRGVTTSAALYHISAIMDLGYDHKEWLNRFGQVVKTMEEENKDLFNSLMSKVQEGLGIAQARAKPDLDLIKQAIEAAEKAKKFPAAPSTPS